VTLEGIKFVLPNLRGFGVATLRPAWKGAYMTVVYVVPRSIPIAGI
jgi:hypothetical protein